ncbi:MAG: NAD(P)/FAD-dependent oxidoreductase [Gemmatimonadales bacterium]
MPTIAVIGAGAAGLMAAIHAASPTSRVMLLERTRDGGRKILISGGGRCNVLPAVLDERRFVTASSPHTMRKILRSWPLADQRRFFEQTLHLPLVVEDDTGKLFPAANRARVVRDALLDAARQRHVEWINDANVVGLERVREQWQVATSDGRHFDTDAVIVATGGLSVPSTGSDGFGLRRLAELGHTIHDTYPALTPITLDPPQFADLAGISLTVEIAGTSSAGQRAVRGGFLFTHRGYSGPAVLDISDMVVRSLQPGAAPAQLRVRWTPMADAEWQAEFAPAAHSIATTLRRSLPSRLADRLLTLAGVDGTSPLAQLTRASRRRLVDLLVRFPLPWTGDEGYRKAEVTGGGVALDEVDPRTLESRLHPGLFLAGELLDVFGPIGGYNFAWAWATGRLAGLGAANAQRRTIDDRR